MQTGAKNCKTLFLVQSALLAALMCILAPIAVPIGPIPITLGLLAVMLVGVVLEWKRAATALIVYILLGAIGLPVFSGAKSGFGVIVGPTGGYLWSYVLMAIFIAVLAGRQQESATKEMLIAFCACVLSLIICYLLGTLQFTLVADCDWAYALTVCVYPFIPFDIGKAALASVIGVKIRRRLRASGLL